MSDTLTPQQRHQCMSNIHSVSTKPEVKLRKELWRRGFRYRKNDKRLPGSPDIVLPKHRTIIFIHGCFWHGHKGCKYYTIPKTESFGLGRSKRIRKGMKMYGDSWRQRVGLLSSFGNVS